MAIIYEILNDRVLPFLVFEKYESKEKITRIYDELDKEFPKRFILNMNVKEN
jgi:hypothetical protein